MNTTEFAQAMIDWKKLNTEIEELEEEIKAYVLEQKKTQNIGDVRATYSKGRTTYDYEFSAVQANATVEEKHRSEHIDWNAVCKDNNVSDLVIAKQSDPSVRIKITA